MALYAMHYNFCRVHETLKITPAMQLGVTDHIWSIGELQERRRVSLSITPARSRRRIAARSNTG